MDLRAARAERGAVQPKGHVISSEAGRGWNVRWRASSHAQNPVKSLRQDFSIFLAPVRVPQCRRQGSGIRNREPRRGAGRHRLLRGVLLRDPVRCHSRLGGFGGLNLYPPVLMSRPSTPHEFLKTPFYWQSGAAGRSFDPNQVQIMLRDSDAQRGCYAGSA